MGRVHLGPRRIDRGQGQVSIERRVTLAGEVLGARREAAEHADAPAFVVGGDEQPPTQRALESLEEAEESRGALEVPPVEDEARRARVLEETDILVTKCRSRQAEHQALADEVLEVCHVRIVSRASPMTTHRFPVTWMTPGCPPRVRRRPPVI